MLAPARREIIVRVAGEQATRAVARWKSAYELRRSRPRSACSEPTPPSPPSIELARPLRYVGGHQGLEQLAVVLDPQVKQLMNDDGILERLRSGGEIAGERDGSSVERSNVMLRVRRPIPSCSALASIKRRVLCARSATNPICAA
jgi:hypothetical protein